MINKEKNNNRNEDNNQEDIYASFNTKTEENITDDSGSNMHYEKYQYQEPKYKNNTLKEHSVVTKSSKASRFLLLGFYVLIILMIIIAFFLFRADRYAFYLVKDEVSISEGSSYQIELRPKNERYFNYLNYKYAIDDTNIATVDEFGKVTAVNPGTTTLKISLSPGITSKKMRIKCDDVNVESITLIDSNTSKSGTIEMEVDQSIVLKAFINNVSDLVTTVEYSSSDESIAKVDDFGNVTALKAGTATITGIRNDVQGSITIKVLGETIVDEPTVVPDDEPTIAVTGVKLNKSSASINVGGTTYLSATVTPSNATNKKVTWSSSDSSVATVSSGGTVKGIKAGSATITATTNDGSKKATCVVTVNAVATNTKVTNITFSTKQIEKYTAEVITLKPTLTPSTVSTNGVKWSSSDTKVATVSNNGVVTTKAKGQANITASIDGVSASVIIIVREKSTTPATAPAGVQVPAQEVTLNKTSLTVNKGATSTFTIKVSNAAGKISVKSSDTSVLTVSPASISANEETVGSNCNGNTCFFDKWTTTYTVKGIKAGTAYINVTVDDLVSYDEKNITGSGKIGVLVQ